MDADACRRRGLEDARGIVLGTSVAVVFWAVLAVLVVVL